MTSVLVMLGVVVVAILSLAVVATAAWLSWHRAQMSERAGASSRPDVVRASTSRIDSDEAVHEPSSPETFDRVVRVLTLIFLASAGVVAFVKYPLTAIPIAMLIAAALLTIVLLQDILPINGPGRLKHWVEAVAATIFVALLTGLTGGVASPFFVGFLLIVAGASLSLDETAPLLLALLSGACFALVVVIHSVVTLEPDFLNNVMPTLCFDLVVLALLAYLASVVAREQQRAREAALSLSRFDPLTGLYNRAYFFSMLDRELRRSVRTGSRFAVVMFDLDALKYVNDTLGHPTGDELIRGITDAVRRNVRSTDVAARYGGDEFIVLLADTDADGAFTVAEKLRADIAALAVGPADRPARTSASFGIVMYPDDGATIEALIQNADDAMYQAKRNGKDQIVGYRTRTERVATQFRPHRDGDAESDTFAGSGGGRRPPGSPPTSQPPTSQPHSGGRPSGADPSGTPGSAPRSSTSRAGSSGSDLGRAPIAVPIETPVTLPGTRFAPPGMAPWDSTATPPRPTSPRP